MKNTERAMNTIRQTPDPIDIDRVSLEEEFFKSFSKLENDSEIESITELSICAWRPMSSLMFLKVDSLVASDSNFLSLSASWYLDIAYRCISLYC